MLFRNILILGVYIIRLFYLFGKNFEERMDRVPFFIGEPCLVKLPHTHNIPPHTPSAWGSLIFLQRSRSGGGSLLFFLFLFFPVCMVWVRRGTLPINTIMGIVTLSASSAGTVAITGIGVSDFPLLRIKLQHYSTLMYYYALSDLLGSPANQSSSAYLL